MDSNILDFYVLRVGRLIADWWIENITPDITPYWMPLYAKRYPLNIYIVILSTLILNSETSYKTTYMNASHWNIKL